MTMRVSQRIDYALQALVLLADLPPESFVAAGDLADRLQLPRRFVEQQITVLSHAGIVECRRGAAGGCALTRPATGVTVADVVVALQGEVLDIPRQPDSATAEMWELTAQALGGFLREVTLANLAARQAEMNAAATPMYFI